MAVDTAGEGHGVVTVGEAASAHYRIVRLVREPRGTTFALVRDGVELRWPEVRGY